MTSPRDFRVFAHPPIRDAPGRRAAPRARSSRRVDARASRRRARARPRRARDGVAMRARVRTRRAREDRTAPRRRPGRRRSARRRRRRGASRRRGAAVDPRSRPTTRRRPGPGRRRRARRRRAPLAHEMVQGALVRWSVEKPDGPHPPTCVLVHGILGSRRNLQSLAKRLAEKFPSWQFLLVDLRNHGESNTALEKKPEGANTVQNRGERRAGGVESFEDISVHADRALVRGKVAMSMVHQFGRALPRPVQVWVLTRCRETCGAMTSEITREIRFVSVPRSKDRSKLVDRSWRRSQGRDSPWKARSG